MDLTPCSGSAARAALRKGLQYAGIVRNDAHASWLGNVMDQSTLDIICTPGSPLHDQELAMSVQEHFQDIIDAKKEADAAEDKAPEQV